MSDFKNTEEQKRDFSKASESEKNRLEFVNIADHEVEKKFEFRNSELCFRRGARVGIIGPRYKGTYHFLIQN